jgi:hypothetical protein
MQGLEALYTIEFSDFTGPGYRNGGVVVLKRIVYSAGTAGIIILARFQLGTENSKDQLGLRNMIPLG